MNTKMIPKKCFHPFCDQVFKIAVNDFKTKFHSIPCSIDYREKEAKRVDLKNDPRIELANERKHQKCLDMVNKEKMEESGMEDGEQSSRSKLESRSEEKSLRLQENPINARPEELGNVNEIQKPSSEIRPTQETTTIKTKNSPMIEKEYGEKTIGSDTLNHNEITTSAQSKTSEERSMPVGSSVTHSTEPTQLFNLLKEERSNSIQELNESSTLLVSFAKTAKENLKDRSPLKAEMDLVIKALEGARNIQKTKLEYLKFGLDISKNAQVAK